jgi:RNA polymerase sigma-70 factor (ECF subfamily)
VSALEKRLGALMRASLAGDSSAYRRLLDDLSGHLRRYFLRRLGRDRSADAEDLVQETLMAVHSRRATYDASRPFTVWLHALARYKLIDHLRQQKIRATVPVEDIDQLFAEDDAGASSARMDVDTLLDTIPEKQQALIRQVKLEGQSIADVATKTGLSESAIKVSIHRGVKALAMRFRGPRT